MEIKVVNQDITTMNVDVIVNAANPALIPGGGVCGAIHKAGGPWVAADCKTFEMGVHTGDCRMTSGRNLSANYIIHAVGPIYNDGNHGEGILLADCYTNSLNAARSIRATSIAFPSISTGIYGFPPALAAAIACKAVRDWAKENPSSCIETVYFTAMDKRIVNLLRAIIALDRKK